MKRWLPLLLSSLGALLLITAGGWTLGYQPLWAFSFLLYVPLPLRLLLGGLVILAALLVLLVPRRSVGMPSRRFASPPPNSQTILYLILAGLLFWLGREQSYHGDALLKLQLLATQSLRTDPYVWKEPLDSFSAYTLTALVQRWQGSPATAVALLSVLAGVVYVAALIGVIRLLAITRFQQTSYALALLALGSSQLWFGHIENYSLVTAATFVTIVLAIGYLKERVQLGWVGLAAGAAVSFHPQALFAMPALFLLSLPHSGSKDFSLLLTGRKTKVFTTVQSFLILGSSALVAPLLTIALLWLVGAPLPHVGNGYAGDPQLFWRIEQALTPSRLLDALNNLWLIAPLAPLWLVVGGWGLTKVKLRQDPIFRYLSLVTLGLLFYHFSFQNDLPRWRDWDLFAITGPAFTLWGIYSWWAGQNASSGASESGKGHLVSAPCSVLYLPLVFALLFTAAWVGVNHYRLLLRPNPDQREIYRHYQLLDLRAMLTTATIIPATPVCAEAIGCERVSATTFTMPQDGDERPTIFAHAPAQIAWSLQMPTEASFLWLSPALDPVAWGWGGDGVTFAVIVRHDGREETLWSRHLTPTEAHDLDWHEAFVDLSSYAGQSVTLILVTTPGMADNNAGDRAGWGLSWLMRGTVDRRFMP